MEDQRLNIFRNKFKWAVIGAGPAGIVTVGLLLDNKVDAKDILWIDPSFKVGDFGQKWGEVSSNTSVKLFLDFLNQIKSFDYNQCNEKFTLNTQNEEDFTHLKNAADPLVWVTNNLRAKVSSCEDSINEQYVKNGIWNLVSDKQTYHAEKVVLATGSTPKSLTLHIQQ